MITGGNEYGQCGEEPERKEDGTRALRRDIPIPQRCAPKLSIRQVRKEDFCVGLKRIVYFPSDRVTFKKVLKYGLLYLRLLFFQVVACYESFFAQIFFFISWESAFSLDVENVEY